MTTLTLDQAYQRLEMAIERAGSVRKFARQANISPGFVSQVRLKQCPMSDNILAALGLVRVQLFVDANENRT